MAEDLENGCDDEPLRSDPRVLGQEPDRSGVDRNPDDTHAFVVMAYGDSPFLGDCLRSLRAQTRPSEIVIATSTPSLFISQTAVEFGVPLVVNPTSAGIAADWNYALAATAAEIVTLAHQDDVYRPAFLERSLALMQSSPGAALAFTGYQEIGDDGAPKASRISASKHLLERLTLGAETRPSARRLRAFLMFGNPLPCSSVTFDRERLGDFAFSGDYQSNLDWDAWLRLLDQGAVFVRTPERLVGRRHNPLTATSRLIREGVRQREDLAMFRRLWPAPLASVIAWLYQAGY